MSTPVWMFASLLGLYSTVIAGLMYFSFRLRNLEKAFGGAPRSDRADWAMYYLFVGTMLATFAIIVLGLPRF